MLRFLRRVGARFVALVRADPSGVRAGYVALLISTVTGLVAGLTLGSITGTLEELPGLLVLVPAAIGMRGNVFGALGSRLGTAIHTGAFRFTLRRETIVGQNLAAAFSLSISVALVIAVFAKLASVVFGVFDTISIGHFVVVSVVGALISSAVLVLITVGVAAMSARYEWDLDNVAAPLVTSAGDVITLPSLFLATLVLDVDWLADVLAVACTAIGLAFLLRGLRAREALLRRIVRESLPVLAFAGAIDIVAGLSVEKQLDVFATFPALLVMVPPFLGQSGSLGGIFSSRVATKLHLGTLVPNRLSLRPVAEDILLVVAYAIPVFLLVGISSDVAAAIAGLRSPGVVDVIGIALFAGAITTALLVVVAYAAALASHRLGLDPDNHGIPLVTSTLDLLGSVSLILVIVLLGYG
ncbi:MAG: magnesium transporter [Actinomycetota bacterium]